VGTKAEVVKHREAGQGGGALRRGPADKAPPPPPVEEMDGGRRTRRRIEVGPSEWVELYGTASCGGGGGRPHRSHIR